MEDQAAQNAQVERWRAWDEFSELEKAAALSELGSAMLRRHPGWTQEAGALAMLHGMTVQLKRNEHLASPIRWEELSREQLAGRLVEVADWCQKEQGASMQRLHDACLDVAEDLRRTRAREGRER